MKRQLLIDIFNAALEAADPYRAVLGLLRVEGSELKAGETGYDLTWFDGIVVVCAGKGTAPMAGAVEEVLGARVSKGLVVVKYGHGWTGGKLRHIEVLEAAHPLPDEAGARAALRVIELLAASDERTLVLCLLSGGASALLAAPAEGITLEEKRAATDLLLGAGADIFELNSVRKHLSRVKGGQVARLAYPATLVTLIMSDVIGDRLDTIASGPTVPDPTTFAEALGVVKKYSLTEKIPASVLRRLTDGAAGKLPETPKEGEDFFNTTQNLIIGGLGKSLEAARKKATELGFGTEVITAELSGEARDAARRLAARALKARKTHKGPPACLLSGGETTVTVRGEGLGGRNQELALAFAMEIKDVEGITLLSAGTDGSDGPTDAAGAVVDWETAGVAENKGIYPSVFLEDNDSYRFFSSLDSLTGGTSHLKTGPTGTNVMDIQIITIEDAAGA